MSTRRALSLSFLDRYLALAIGIGSSMVIARLLTPSEIGVYSVTMILVSFTMSLRDFGAGQYLVQERELTPDRLRATWTVQLLVGLAFSAVILAAAWPASWFYGDRRIFDIMLVIAVNFAVNPFGSMTYAWLMREMRFDRLAIMRLSAALVGALVSIGLAWSGWGPMSLAVGSLASTLTNAGVAVFFRPAHFPWRPGRRGVRAVLTFGGKVSMVSIVRTLGDGAAELLLGKLQGLASAGLFSRASGLTQMFNRLLLDAVVVVAQPLFAKAHRDTGEAGPVFLKALSYITVLGWSFFLALGLLAEPVIHLLYGLQWQGAVDAARALSVAAAFGVTTALCPIALAATGGIDRSVRLTIFCTGLLVVLVGIGATIGLMEAAVGLAIAQAACTVLWLRSTLQHIGASGWACVRRLAHSGAVALTVGLAPASIALALGWRPPSAWPSVALGLVTGVPLLILAIKLWKHPLSTEIEVGLMRLNLLRKGP